MIPLIQGIPNIECLQLAVAALPGYRQAVELATEADQWLREQPALPTVDPTLRAHVTDMWVDAERAQETALVEYEARRRIVQKRLHEEANRAQSIFNTGADLILGALQSDLTKLLDRVAKTVPDLDGATTAQQAIAADAGPAWRQLTELASQYQELRDAQTFVMLKSPVQLWKSCTPSLPGEDHANLCFVKNLEDIWGPAWRQPGMRTYRIDLSDRSTPHRDEPWPPNEYGPEMLIWLHSSEAQPWCPTTRQIRELFKERDAPAPVDDDHEEPESEPYESLLYGPLEAERKRQAEAAAQRRKPDYTRVMAPITHRTPAELAEVE
jgi:hypothetical protein